MFDYTIWIKKNVGSMSNVNPKNLAKTHFPIRSYKAKDINKALEKYRDNVKKGRRNSNVFKNDTIFINCYCLEIDFGNGDIIEDKKSKEKFIYREGEFFII
jgi:hypothetical protein